MTYITSTDAKTLDQFNRAAALILGLTHWSMDQLVDAIIDNSKQGLVDLINAELAGWEAGLDDQFEKLIRLFHDLYRSELLVHRLTLQGKPITLDTLVTQLSA